MSTMMEDGEWKMASHRSEVVRGTCTRLCTLFIALGIVCAVALPSRGDDGWSLTTSDFKRQTVNLKGFDDQGAQVVVYGQTKPTTVGLDKLLQLDRGGAAVQQVRGAFTLYLTSGDRVGGEPVSIANDKVAWKSPAAGDLSIPLKNLRGIQRGQETPTFDSGRTEDLVMLSNGDSVKGIITGLDAGKISVAQASGDPAAIDMASVKTILFAAAKGDNPTGRAFRVQLSDGSVVTAPKVQLKNNMLILKLGEGEDRPVDLGQVVLIEQLNGPVSWLSARVPAETIYQPMFDVSFPPQMDRNYRGEKIKFGGHDYTRGIGVHAYCKLTYALDGSFKAFRTQYALSEDAYKGKVTVRILLDDKVVHEARDFVPGKLSPIVQIELGNAKTLSLEAHPGGDATTDDRTQWHIDTQARLNWIEPALLKQLPAAKVETPKKDSAKPAEPESPKLAPPTAPTAQPPVEASPAPKPADAPKPDAADAPKPPVVEEVK
jgi:hypothetical protein